ncbi:MAG: hypothetical protein QXE81_01070 [Desulfurococcaceae archaeon]
METITLVPTNNKNASSFTSSVIISDPKLIEHGVIDGNLWGLGKFVDQYSGYLKVFSDEGGYIKFKSNLDLTRVPLSSWNVIAYPEIYYGLKPWTPGIKPLMRGTLELPMKLSDLPTLYILVDYVVVESTSPYNVALDMWLLRDQYSRTPREGDVEVMIWLHRDGYDHYLNPPGRKIGSLKTPILIDGKLKEVVFDVWIQERIGNGWTYVAFVLNHSNSKAEIGLDITSLLNRAIENLRLRGEDLYIFSIEFGFELFYNDQVNFHASIYRFDIKVSSISNPIIIHNLSERSKRVVTWITPWGYLVDVERFNKEFTPGIIVPYDIECELCTKTLMKWFNRSLQYMKEFKNRGKPLFINIFPEKYYPEWIWRGKLETFKLPNNLLVELKKIINDGEYTYIGFSELTSCLNNEICFTNLINGYKTIRAFFPAARTFYYGSGDDELESIIRLQREAELDIVGIDIWIFDFRNNKLYIDDNLVSKIKSLASTIPRVDLIVGELGLRLNDREAYVEPWNWARPIVYERGVHLRFFENIFEHLEEIDIPLSYIGIWSWNDGIYSVSDDLDTQYVIVKCARSLGLVPKDPCSDKNINEGSNTIMNYLLILIAIMTCLTATLIFIAIRIITT